MPLYIVSFTGRRLTQSLRVCQHEEKDACQGALLCAVLVLLRPLHRRLATPDPMGPSPPLGPDPPQPHRHDIYARVGMN